MKTKLTIISLILICFLFSGTRFGNAANRNYRVENCSRAQLWPEILKDLKWRDPETAEFIDKNIKPVQERPQLTDEDYQQIERFDKRIHYFLSECMLLIKEVNVLIKEVHKIDPNKTWAVGDEIRGTLDKYEIPFDYKYTKKDEFIFYVIFAPLTPGETF